MLESLNVFATNGLMQRCTGAIPYTSLTWQRRYYECGQFEMVVPADIYDPAWRFIVCDERPETGIIQKREYSDTSTVAGGRDTVTLSGFFLESIINYHTFLEEKPEVTQTRFWIDPPDPPIRYLNNPKVYMGPDGYYYYPTGDDTSYGVAPGTPMDSPDRKVGGKIVEDDDGNAMMISDDGAAVKLDKVEYEQDYNTYYWYDQQDSTTICTVQTNGGEHDYKVEFNDSDGNVYYKDEDGTLRRAIGVNKKSYDTTYSVEYKKYGHWGWHYETIVTLGPWQTTEAADPITEQDNIQLCMKWVRQYFQNQLLYEDCKIEGVKKKLDPSFQLLGDLLYTELQTVEASFRVQYLFESNQFIFRIWRGTDRTQETNAGNDDAEPWVVFSEDFGNLYDFVVRVDDSNYKNVCFVLYRYNEPEQWNNTVPDIKVTATMPSGGGATGLPSEIEVWMSWFDKGWDQLLETCLNAGYVPDSWEIPTRQVWGTVKSTIDDGNDYPDRETYLDVRDEEPSFAPELSGQIDINDWQNNYGLPTFDGDLKSKYENYEDNLFQQGVTKLQTDYPIITEIDTGDLSAMQYLTDYDLGDKVDVVISTIGVTETARIIGVDEVYEASDNSVTRKASIIIGNEQPTDIKRARLI